ncbi:MAG TPA: tRNA (guanosine(46)-N7)-methyltransferase TrmB [Campylobacterales bacterium]|nr:tRNA (guanosine(46)-N7)-methyltransferase TrmB [Campylobacterales bacterium]
MPHIRIDAFDTSRIEVGKYGETQVHFRAQDMNGQDEMLGVELEGENFLLHIKKAKNTWLLKYEKVTRPLNVNLLKQAIGDIANALGLKVLDSNITIHKAKTEMASAYEKRIEDFADMAFPLDNVAIEVGFGSGKHLLYQAQQNPDTLYIGIEIHTPSAQQVLRQIELQGLSNIWVVNYDARLLLEMIPSNACQQIFVHFPVPWDKKPHRRVISPSFLEESMRTLKPEGRLELRTDSYNYFWYALDTFLGENVPKTALEIRKNEALAITSKYEARWLRQEKDIYDVFVRSLGVSQPRDLSFDFAFNKIKYKEKLLKQFSKKPLLFEGYFIHFERLYRLSESSVLLKLAFGSFDRPEHKYIFMDATGSYYFGSEPVKTVTNYKTHLKIMEYLDV